MMRHTRPLATILVVLLIALGAGNDTATAAGGPTVNLVDNGQHAGIVPIGGLRHSGVTLTDAAQASDTKLYITEHRFLKVGQTIEISNQELMQITALTDSEFSSVGVLLASPGMSGGNPGDVTVANLTNSLPLTVGMIAQVFDCIEPDPCEQMLITATSGDGAGGVQDTMTVVRGRAGSPVYAHSTGFSVLVGPGESMSVQRPIMGTTAIPHAANSVIYADASEFQILVSNVGSRTTSTALASTLSAATFEDTSAVLTEAATSSPSALTLKVNDATLVRVGRTIQVDSEKMVVSTAKRGYLSDLPPGIFGVPPLDSGADVTADLPNCSPVPPDLECADPQATTLSISNKNLLNPGWIIRSGTTITTTPYNVDLHPEELLVVAVAGDGPGGSPDTATVVREFGGTFAHEHISGDDIFGGPDRVTVSARGCCGTTAAAHSAGAAVLMDLRVANLNAAPDFQSGSVLQVEAEQIQAIELNAKYLHNTGASLLQAVGTGDTVLRVTDATLANDGGIIKLENEFLAVKSVADGCADAGVPTGAQLAVDALAGDTVLTINDWNSISVGCTVTIDAEEMKVVSKTGDGPNPPGTDPETVTVVRNYYGAGATGHASGAPLLGATDSAKVVRGLYTTAATHAGSTPVRAVLADPNAGKFARGLNGTTSVLHNPGAVLTDLDGLGSYSVTVKTALADPAVSLIASATAGATQILISNKNPLKIGWTVLVEDERVKITNLLGDGAGGAPDAMDVVRAQDGTIADSHASGTSVLGPVVIDYVRADNSTFLASSGRTVRCDPHVLTQDSVTQLCDTQGNTPQGPSGAGFLATFRVRGKSFLPGSPTQANRATVLSPLTVQDITADPAVPTAGNGVMRTIRCPDFDGNRIANFSGDVINVAQAALLPSAPKLPQHDVDGNGVINFSGDVVASALVILIGKPGPVLRCIPFAYQP
ncbi:MAG: hypothetical protein WEC75_08935 [Dehalococcoidia bacterium]